MAEYYPLLRKAVGSLPNSTADTRRIVYERARKALIGQLRTLHPPVPDEDIEREAVELDRAIERIEMELAAAAKSAVAETSVAGSSVAEASVTKSPEPVREPQLAGADDRPAPLVSGLAAVAPDSPSGTLGPVARKPIMPLRPRTPKPASMPVVAPVADPVALKSDRPPVSESPVSQPGLASSAETDARPRLEGQRPIAPLPPVAKGPKRRIWIVPLGLGVVIALVALAAWKLRDRPETIARTTPAATTQSQKDSGKIADRVGAKKAPDDGTSSTDQGAPATPAAESSPTPAPQAAAPSQTAQQTAPAASNPELPVAHRAALLVEAPDLPSKVQTFPGTVVWKLNNVSDGPSDAVGLSVEADIDLPDDKTKAVVVFEKNTDPSLPASHTIKVRFMIEPGSYSGDIKQISVPQMRREGNSDGEPLAGVTVPVIQNSFLVGLSPGNAETANLRLISDLPWMDIPILLTSGKIAKLTFEKGASGQRDIADALASWQKQ